MLTGGIGGLVGFAWMELATRSQPVGTWWGEILHMAFYFAGFGLAVGAALGMTEGLLRRKPGRLIYGLLVGLILGGIGGYVGGAIGQAIYGLVPQKYSSRSTSDLAIALDSSGSMGGGFLLMGNDPFGERKKAAEKLIEHVSDTDRIAIVDFDDAATVLFPLTFMGSGQARSAAKDAVDQVDDSGGTNLSAGLDAGIAELSAKHDPKRRQFLIFLTDGMGAYDASSLARAKIAGITIYTVGLGSQVDAGLLGTLATETGGQYFPVQDASALTTLFEQIREITGTMTGASDTKSTPQEKPLTDPKLMFMLRILSWALMGLAIGLGQGVRENTREDLFACSLGGFLGGAIGGALFDPLTVLLTFKSGLAGRALADLVVGACIGGSMRFAQEKMIEASGKSTTTLFSALPAGRSVTFEPASGTGPIPVRPGPTPAPLPTYQGPIPIAPAKPVPPMERTPVDLPPPAPVASTSVASSRPSLQSFEVGVDREEAMRRAFKAGYGYSEIAKHFEVAAPAVRRAVSGG